MGLSWRLVSSPRVVRFIYFTLLVTDLHKIGILPPLSLRVELGDSLPQTMLSNSMSSTLHGRGCTTHRRWHKSTFLPKSLNQQASSPEGGLWERGSTSEVILLACWWCSPASGEGQFNCTGLPRCAQVPQLDKWASMKKIETLGKTYM